MNKDFLRGMFIGACVIFLILSMFALISDKDFLNNNLQFNLAIEKGASNAR